MTRVINKYKTMVHNGVDIGRGSIWGNPFSHMEGTTAMYRVSTREEAVQKYRVWILTQLHLLERLHELEGKTLMCFCKPLACHGDVLIELLNNKELVRMSMEQMKAKIAAQKVVRADPAAASEGIFQNRKRTDAVVTRPAPVVPMAPPIHLSQEQPKPAPAILGANGQPLRRPAPPGLFIPKPAGYPPVIQAPNPPHVLITMADCTCENDKYCSICDGGLNVCRICGEFEAGLDNPCKPNIPEVLQPVVNMTDSLPKLTRPQAEALISGGSNALAVPLPMGYMALGKNDKDALMWCKAEIMLAQIMGFDYETNGDPDDDTTDPQDHKIVGVSFSWKIGFAIYIPVAHENYGANWDWQELRSIFLKPLLEHPDILIIAHNIKVEYQWSLTHGIDFFHKVANRKVMDTMLMVKALALPENTEYDGESYEVKVGLKPATKALLADEHGMIHGLLHVDEVKSFVQTVGKHTWTTEHWDESMGYYKSNTTTGKKKGDKKVKVTNHSRSRTFNELPVDKTTVDYGASDSDWALGVYFKLIQPCTAEGLMDTIFELDIPRMLVLAEYELAGWHVSRDRLFALRLVAEKALWGDPEAATEAGRWGLEYLLNGALIELVPNANIVVDKKTGWNTVEVPAGKYPMGDWRKQKVELPIGNPAPFNFGSWQHKTWLFYHILKFPMAGVERSKTTGLPTTNGKQVDKFIDSYEGDSKFMTLLKSKSKYDKINSTYVEGLLPFCREDTDKCHTNLMLINTWRLSSKKPNLQNIPRPENDVMGIRGVFHAPFYSPTGQMLLPAKRLLGADGKELTSEARIITPSDMNPFTAKTWHFIIANKLSGHTFYIGSDYAQIELKVLAWFAREMEMMRVLVNGGDLHSWVANKVFKLGCNDEEVKDLFKPFRYKAKAVNFGLVYGLTEFGLSKDPAMGMTVEQAAKFIEDYMATFPGVRRYAQDMIAFGREYGYVETMFGHRRPVPHINDSNQWVRKKAENICMNTPIQGSAADIIALAMVNIRNEQHLCPELSMHMQIHDELQGEAPVEYAVKAAVFMKEVMERHVDGFSDTMPIISEPAVGATWGTALDLKWDASGNPYVKPKSARKEASDVTYDDIAPYEHMYKLAGIKIA